MVCAENGTRYSKNGRIIFTGNENGHCPHCGGSLHVRGTCTRKLRGINGTQVYRLRVLECDNCGKSHRELPPEMIPYKRLDTESISKIAQTPKGRNLECAETSTWHRICAWVIWFLRYAQNEVGSSVYMACVVFEEKLSMLVRIVVNSGKWIQHRLV